MDKEEIEKAHKFLEEMDKEGYRWTANGREKYIIENVFKPIQQLETRVKELEADNYELNCRINDLLDKDEHTKSLENKVKVLGKQIAELEEEKQKVIDKLEQEKNTIEMTYSQINGNYFMAQDRLDLINEILEIYNKGDKNERD